MTFSRDLTFGRDLMTKICDHGRDLMCSLIVAFNRNLTFENYLTVDRNLTCDGNLCLVT